MKKLIFFLFISVGINAQFNYQAIVKESNGNLLTNNQVKFKFSLMYQSSTATPVFVEEHDITTPADGVVNLSVGGGTVVNGTFSNIDWSQNVFMKEELDTGSGYQDMGTKQLTTVPYAEYSSGVKGVNLTGENVAVGNYAMQNKDFTTSAGNIAIGEYALQTRTTEISNGSINVAIGYNALKDNRSGDDNVAINKGALEKNNDGNNNIAIGTNSINKNINGGSNIAIGQYSLESSISASQSIAIGYQAMQYFNNGGEVVTSANTAIGVYALRGESSTSSNTGRGNTAVGYSSLGNNTTGTGNTAFGKNSLLLNNEGDLNTAIGNGSMYNNTQGIRNTSLGYQSLFNNTQGNYNVTVGYGSGFDNTVGDRLTLIGYNSDTEGESNLTNATAIGADATVISSNTIQLGNTDVTLVNTSGVVSATGFKGSGDEITLTDSGTIVTLLYKIAQLEDKIEVLEANQSATSNTSSSSISSAYAFFEKHGGKIWASSSNSSTSRDYLQWSIVDEIESEEKVATDYEYEDGNYDDCNEYFFGDNPNNDNCSGVILQLVSNSPDEIIFKTIDYDECENGNDGSLNEITFTIVGDKMYQSEIGESTFEYWNLVSSVQGTNCFD